MIKGRIRYLWINKRRDRKEKKEKERERKIRMKLNKSEVKYFGPEQYIVKGIMRKFV